MIENKKIGKNSGQIAVSSLALALFSLIIFGYPIVGTLHVFIGGPTSSLTYPFRIITIIMVIVVIILGLRRSQFRLIDKLVLVFISLYTIRLLYDWVIVEVHGAEEALLYFYALTVFPMLACSLKVAHLREERKIQDCLLISGGVFAALSLLAHGLGLGYNPWADSGYTATRLGFEALNPISVGVAAGTLAIVGLFVASQKDSTRRRKLLGNIGFFLGVLLILLANSRGPILALIITIIAMRISRPKKIIWILGGAAVYLLFLGQENALVTNVMERLGDAGSSDDPASLARIEAMSSAWWNFLDNPIVGYHYIDPALGGGLYPHNLLLESAMSLGIIGILIFSMLIIKTLLIITKDRKMHSIPPTLSALFIFFFIGTNFSGSIWGAQSFFVTMAICLALSKSRNVE